MTGGEGFSDEEDGQRRIKLGFQLKISSGWCRGNKMCHILNWWHQILLWTLPQSIKTIAVNMIDSERKKTYKDSWKVVTQKDIKQIRSKQIKKLIYQQFMGCRVWSENISGHQLTQEILLRCYSDSLWQWRYKTRLPSTIQIGSDQIGLWSSYSSVSQVQNHSRWASVNLKMVQRYG